ncbi:extracellular solute-binding protein [Yeguia hominis]|uniref:Extracellular solute-binding protein n=1 Tax=Yeguia hominis TaxID=2763662 RepID=A0A926DBY6_9FIRM|nr:extracellular solute-binding protein [Yeguia hominis]
MKRVLLVLLALLLAVSLLASCNSGSENSSAASNETQSADSSEPISVRWIQHQIEYADPLNKLVDKYMDEHPNVTINLEVNGTNYWETLKSLLAANDVPDIFMTDGYNVMRSYVDYLEDLSDEDFVDVIKKEARQCVDGERLDFKKWKGKSESDLLDNLFPRTKFTNGSIKATILTFAPVGANGDRLRAIVYGIYLENISERTVDLAVEMPRFGSEKDCFATHGVSWLPVEERFAEDQPCKFQLSARQSKWISVVLYAPGEYQDAEAVVNKGMLFWLNETHDYLRKILGRLTMPGDPMTAFLYERAVCQCLGAIAMNQEDQISGANWGSYPLGSKTGEVSRLYHNCGKCGWASGIFAVTFLTQILGLQYCGVTQKLVFRPFSPCSDFTFEGIRLGNAVFDVDYKHLKNQASIPITNRNDFSIALELEVVSDGEAFCATETISSIKRKFMERDTVATSLKLQKNETVQVNFS